MTTTITLAEAPNEMGRWLWVVIAPDWTAASTALTFEEAARQARAEIEKQESIRRPTP
jgi:hypothetical protein